MVNISFIKEFFYNLFFNANKKRNAIKEKGHILVFQNKHEMTNKEKKITYKYNQIKNKLEQNYSNYMQQQYLRAKQKQNADSN